MENETLIEPYEGKFSAILLFGPPGSGKKTLGKFLASTGSQYHLSSGKIFRGLPPSSPYYSFARKGLLIPDDATIEIWKYYVQGLIATNVYYPECQDLLLDGIPRTERQAEILSSYINVKHVIVLDVADNQLLLQRMLDKARLEGRGNDVHPELIQRNLEGYQEKAERILNCYPKHLRSIVNGAQKPLEVLRDVLMRLSHLLSQGPSRS